MINLSKKKHFETFCGILIAFFTFILIVESIYFNSIDSAGNDAKLELSSNYNFYQAKKNRQTVYKLFYEKYQVDLLKNNLSEQEKQTIISLMAEYKKTINRYESDPSAQDGEYQIMNKIKQNKLIISDTDKKSYWFHFAESLLQICIVLISVSLIISSKPLLTLGIILGTIGVCLTLNTVLLLFPI